jgi:redox-sensitive bicupin YhaK (pirin superfamily)
MIYGQTACRPPIYADVRLEPGAALPLDTAHEERAVYVVSGAMNTGGDRFPSGQRPSVYDANLQAANREEAVRSVRRCCLP